MSTFTGVARIVGIVAWRAPRLIALAIRTNSSLGSSQRRAAESFHETLLAQGLPAELSAQLAKEYPKWELRDFMSGLPRGQSGGKKSQDGDQ